MQNVGGTPRIYVDILSYLQAIGKLKEINNDFGIEYGRTDYDLIGLRPSDFCQLSREPGDFVIDFVSKIEINKILTDNTFHAVLGHDFATNFVSYNVYASELGGVESWIANDGKAVNWESIYEGEGVEWGALVPQFNGWSLSTGTDGAAFEGKTIRWFLTSWESSLLPSIGSLAFGNYFDFPVSPDLQLSQTIEMDGVEAQKTKGGVEHSRLKYKGNPKWGSLGAWELGGFANDWQINAFLNARSGRRSWDLSFSYIPDTDMFPTSSLGGGIITDPDEYDSSNISADGTETDSTLLKDDSFYSAVWNRTLGGRLPFIFQIDKNNFNPDQFAICKFDQDKLDIKRVAHNVYSIKVKIREVW